MSKKKRILMLLTLIVIFFIAGPVLLLLATGYSIHDVVSLTKINLQRTGGVYVVGIGSDSSVFLDNELVGNSSFLDRSVLAQRLSPRIHNLRVERPGFREWKKDVLILPTKVTEIHPVLITDKVSFEKIIDTNLIKLLSTTLAEKISNTISTTTGKIVLDSGRVQVRLFDGILKVRWEKEEDVPQFMCLEKRCDTFTNISLPEYIQDIEWLGNSFNAILAVSLHKIYLVEIDPREGRLITPLLVSKDFRLSSFTKPQLISYKGDYYLSNSKSFFKLVFETIK